MNLQLLVPRPGIEPGWVAPLVFETSASTDSAIWAMVFAKERAASKKLAAPCTQTRDRTGMDCSTGV